MKKIKEIFSRESFKKSIEKIPIGVVIGVSVLPALLTILFYILRLNENAMYWVMINISTPVRGFMAMITSVYPFSMMELLLTFIIIWFIYYIVKTISIVSRKRNKLKVLSKRVLLVVVLALYIWNAFCWLWISGYFAPGFADRNNIIRNDVAVEDLIAVTRYFAQKTNELAAEVQRDSNGSFNESRSDIYTKSTGIYRNAAITYRELNSRLYRPKPMIFSFLMSRTGYSGMYFALTGEANINNMIHGSSLPVTISHEHAHHLGIFLEDEANFISILACVKSDNAAFVYSGYLRGLNYLLRSLDEAELYAKTESHEAAMEIASSREEILDSLIYEVRLDRWENYLFWQSQRTVDTGVRFVDTALTAVTDVMRDTVDSVYDGFLKAQGQELGLRSYGACVDLLVGYFIKELPLS